MNKDVFRDDCIKKQSDIVVQKHLIDGSSYFFDIVRNGGEFEFKKDLAKSLNVHIRDIVIVGSGKLGFSLKPDSVNPALYLFRDFDYHFNQNVENEKSDLDIAIVSGNLFDHQLIELYKHTEGYSDSTYNSSNKKKDFAKYILKGWLRPDKVPDNYKITTDVIKVQNDYKMEYGREVNIGIYKSWYFFESYHKNNIKNIQLNLIAS